MVTTEVVDSLVVVEVLGDVVIVLKVVVLEDIVLLVVFVAVVIVLLGSSVPWTWSSWWYAGAVLCLLKAYPWRLANYYSIDHKFGPCLK